MKNILAPLCLYLAVFGICIAVVVAASCGSSANCSDPKNANSAQCVAQNAVIDCTTQAAQDYVAAHGGDLSQFFSPNGIDWSGVEQKLTSLGVDLGVCVLEKEFNHYFGGGPVVASGDAGVGSAGSATPPATNLKVNEARAKANELEAKLYPGKRVKAAP